MMIFRFRPTDSILLPANSQVRRRTVANISVLCLCGLLAIVPVKSAFSQTDTTPAKPVKAYPTVSPRFIKIDSELAQLDLTESQQAKISRLQMRAQRQIAALKKDKSLNSQQRKAQGHILFQSFSLAVKQSLTKPQKKQLRRIVTIEREIRLDAAFSPPSAVQSDTDSSGPPSVVTPDGEKVEF